MRSGFFRLLIVLHCASFLTAFAQPVSAHYPQRIKFSSLVTLPYNYFSSTLFPVARPLTATFTQACKEIDWTVWSSIGGRSASGAINSQGTAVNINMTSSFDFELAPQLWRPEEFRRFKGNMPASGVPRTSWSKEPGGKITICFSQAVKEPVLLLASLGSYKERIQTTISFSEPYTMVFNDGGMIVNGNTSITGREGYAIIKFPGDIKCVTITSSTYENFTDLTWGIPVCPEGLKQQPKAPEPPEAKPAPIAKTEPPITPAKKIESPPASKPAPAAEPLAQPAKLAAKAPEPVPVPKPVAVVQQPAPAIAKAEPPPTPPAKKIESVTPPQPAPKPEPVAQPAKLAAKVPEPLPVPKPVVAAPQPVPAIAKAEQPPTPPAKKIESVTPPQPAPAVEPLAQPAKLAAKAPEPLPAAKPVASVPKPTAVIAQTEKPLQQEKAIETIAPPKPAPPAPKTETVAQPAKFAAMIPEPAPVLKPVVSVSQSDETAISVPVNSPAIPPPAPKPAALVPKSEPALAASTKAVTSLEKTAPPALSKQQAIASSKKPPAASIPAPVLKPQTRPVSQPASPASLQPGQQASENRITIAVSDYDGVDRDSISLKFNNKPLGPASIQLQLSSRNGSSESTFGLDLQPGNNSLEIYALSEGLKPFTTVCLQIRYPGKTKNLYFTLKAKESTVIQL